MASRSPSFGRGSEEQRGWRFGGGGAGLRGPAAGHFQVDVFQGRRPGCEGAHRHTGGEEGPEDFGGLAGADKHCQTLAAAAGAGNKTWRAYLSTQATGATPAVNARDRMGKGPWQNAKGVVIAKDVTELHGTNNLNKQTALNEKGAVVNGRGDSPNQHDILTG